MTKINYDSDFCGNLPLHLINSIQSYGALLLLDEKQFNIIQASENIVDFLGTPATDLINKQLEDVVGSMTYGPIKMKMDNALSNNYAAGHFILENLQKEILFFVHRKEKYIILEFEPARNSFPDFTEIFYSLRYSIELIKKATTVVEICQFAAKEIKAISGFDKVMIYQFDEDWNGNVLAEEKEADMDSYMGLRFPASDIPKQARALYLKNPYRFIPDRTYEPVKLHPVLNPLTFGYSDLSDCNLRGVAPVHLEYLGNMNVVGSMSTAIIRDGKLWGLIACHHKTVKVPTYCIRSALEMLSNFISSHILAIENIEMLQLKEMNEKIHDGLFTGIARATSLPEGIILSGNNLLQLLDASGVVYSAGSEMRQVGEVPAKALIDELIHWLYANHIDQIFARDSIETLFQVSNERDKIYSGFLAIPIRPSKKEYIIAFRKEALQTILWGGNPNNAIQREEDEKVYHPRNSFGIWKETIRNKSIPWNLPVLDAAAHLKQAVNDILYLKGIS